MSSAGAVEALADIGAGGDDEQWRLVRLWLETPEGGSSGLRSDAAAEDDWFVPAEIQRGHEPVQVLCPLGEDEAAVQPTLAERLQDEVGVDELVGDVADHCRAGVGCLIQDLWIQNGTLTMGLMATVSIPTLLTMVASGRIPAEKMGTHHFTFDQMDEAYDTFKNAGDRLALKTVITPAQ